MENTLSLLYLSCRRIDLLTRTLAAARRHFIEVENDVAVTHVCFDNGSAPDEHRRLLDLGFDLLLLSRENLGIGPAMNRLVSMVRTPFFLNLQDDWILENPNRIRFFAESLRIFTADAKLAQLKLDLHHFTNFADREMYAGPFRTQGDETEYYVQNPGKQWGGFAFPPAITRTSALWQIGPFIEEQPFRRGWAESEYSWRFARNFVAAKSPQLLLFRHIGDEPCPGWATYV